MATHGQTPIHRALNPGRGRTLGMVVLAMLVTAFFVVERSEPNPISHSVPPPEAEGQTLSGQVVRVVDGDSLHVQAADGLHKVRLAWIDAPEYDQPGYEEATRFVADLVADREVTLQVIDHDPYGRLVARVTLPDGTQLGERTVGAGWAWWYRFHAPHQEALATLEREAREARRGLWAMPDPVAPWTHRAQDWRR